MIVGSGRTLLLLCSYALRVCLEFWHGTPSLCLRRCEHSSCIWFWHIRLFPVVSWVGEGCIDSCWGYISGWSILQGIWRGYDCWVGIELMYRRYCLLDCSIFQEKEDCPCLWFYLGGYISGLLVFSEVSSVGWLLLLHVLTSCSRVWSDYFVW